MSARVRINRFLSTAGLGSRRKCEELIRKGVVFVNGKRIEDLSVTIDPDKDSISVDGKQVKWTQKKIVLILNKPAGVISAVVDSFKRKTVIDLARENGYTERLFPVGRLDLDTSGVLVITNDGELAYRLTHPRFKIEKTYLVKVEGEITDEVVSRISSGIISGDFVTKPCKIKVLKRECGITELEVKLKEGRKRQIRRMFGLFAHKVVSLHRIALGDLEFKDLEIGEIRPMTPGEKRHLRHLSGLV